MRGLRRAPICELLTHFSDISGSSIRHSSTDQQQTVHSGPPNRFADPPKKLTQDLSEVQMMEMYPAHRKAGDNADSDGMPQLRNVYSVAGGADEGPSYRVTWFDFDIHPSKRFLIWAFRRLRELPPGWRGHYRIYLRQETKAQIYLNNTWDVFMGVVDGYRKAKWVLRKYDVPIDASLIPYPYNDFWEVTTPEERAWAQRRSTLMKEEQAVQRAMEDDDDDDEFEDDEPYREDAEEGLGTMSTQKKKQHGGGRKESEGAKPIFGGGAVDFRDHHISVDPGKDSSKVQSGNLLHSNDMQAPSEADIDNLPSRLEQDRNSFVMGTIEDDKLWNPVLKNRLYQQKAKEESDLYAFEDEDDDDVAPNIKATSK